MPHSMSVMRKRVTGASLATVAVFAMVACSGESSEYAAGDTIKLTLGAGHAAGGAITYTNHAQNFFVPEVERRVAEETEYEVDIDEQYGGSVAPLEEVLESTQTGIIDIGLVPYPFEPANLPLLNVSYYVPFGSPDVDQTLKAANHMLEENPEIKEDLEKNWNQTMLAAASVGDYGLGTTFKVGSMEDLDGKKLSGAGTNLEWVKAAGAVPVQGSLNDWYTGIQTGVYDGAVIFIDAFSGFKLHEVAENFTNVGFGSVLVGGIHVNNDSFKKLPEDVRTIIEEVAAEYEATFKEAVDKDQATAMKTLADAGVTPVDLPEDERIRWAEAIPNMPQQLADEVNKAGGPGSKAVNDYLQGLADAGYTSPRDWEVN